jgi:hypothetical protein
MPDWGWLLGIGVLKPFLVADQLGLPLRRQAEALQDELATLGPTGLDQNFHLPWGLIRLVLHRGDPDLHAITADDVDELRHAIRTLDRIPTIDQVIAPAASGPSRPTGEPPRSGWARRCSTSASPTALQPEWNPKRPRH